MNFTRRFFFALPLIGLATKVAAAPVEATPEVAAIREPYVRVGGWIREICDFDQRKLPSEREFRVLAIGEWDGESYPVTTSGWFEETHVVPDRHLLDSTFRPWLKDFADANDMHWARYGSVLAGERYVRAMRGIPEFGGRRRKKFVETFLLDKTGASWPVAYEWNMGPRYTWA